MMQKTHYPPLFAAALESTGRDSLLLGGLSERDAEKVRCASCTQESRSRKAYARHFAGAPAFPEVLSARWLLWRALAVLAASVCVLLAGAQAALAQSSGAGDLLSFLDQLVQLASQAMIGVGTLGLMASAIVWVASGTNDRRKEKATSWMMGTGLVALVGFGAPTIMGFIQSIAPGGGA